MAETTTKKWIQVYVPVCVDAEIDAETGEVLKVENPQIDFEGAPWSEANRVDDVWDTTTDEWLNRRDSEEIALAALDPIGQILRLGASTYQDAQRAQGEVENAREGLGAREAPNAREVLDAREGNHSYKESPSLHAETWHTTGDDGGIVCDWDRYCTDLPEERRGL